MIDLMLYGAVPFNFTDDSIAARRGRKTEVQPELSLDQVLMLEVANEAADAIQFMLGPRHRARHTSTSPSYRNPEIKSYRCPPNTPVHKLSFDFTATDADCSDSETSAEEGQDSRPGISNQSNRKRRRLVSFSSSAPDTRRVPHKKPTDNNSGRKIFSRKKKWSALGSGPDLTDGAILPSLNFFAEIQKAAGDCAEEAMEQRWRKLGKSLRAIADRFSGVGLRKRRQAKEISLDALPNSLWSVIVSYVFWKLIKEFR